MQNERALTGRIDGLRRYTYGLIEEFGGGPTGPQGATGPQGDVGRYWAAR
jgi:hypothetical protein